MSGYAYDTSTLTLTAVLDDGSKVVITGANDGVNGIEWSATHDDADLPLTVDEDVLIDGIEPAEEST